MRRGILVIIVVVTTISSGLVASAGTKELETGVTRASAVQTSYAKPRVRPPAPKGHCSARTYTNTAYVSWSWAPIPTANRYFIYYSRGGRGTQPPTWENIGLRTSYGSKLVLPGPRHIIWVLAQNESGNSLLTRLDCPNAAPSGNHQYAEVKKIAGISSDATAYSIDEFLAEKFPSNIHHPTQAPYPYLTWNDDDCSLGSAEPARRFVQKETGFGNEYDPPAELFGLLRGPLNFVRGAVAPKAPFKHGCWRHDFAWRNLSRIEQKFPFVDSWNQTNYNLTNSRLGSDWNQACKQTYNFLLIDIRMACQATAKLALDVMILQTSVATYASNANDVGYTNG